MEHEAIALPKGTRFEDRYEILGGLGSGSFGRVYQARQLSTGQSVAIKVLSPREDADESSAREAERFRRETRICAALSHINIVRLIDSGETQDGQLYAVFEHVPGETLEQALSREGALGVRECVRLMTQVLEALGCAHAQGIVHRDLKPANLMLSAAGVRRSALVLDFGVGGLAEGRRRQEWQTLTQTREFLGTPLYASPEQLAGERATARSDLYAWGLVFLECLTGRHPFAEAGAAARLLTGGGAVEIPEWLRGHRLGELLEAVTAREAEKRDLSVEALIEALDQIAGGGELPVAPEASPLPPPLSEQGERRHLTVLFCDLVGSSALGQRLDTEAYRRIVQAYHARAAEAIARYEGHVGLYMGDGLLVYFGYPQAHEDDAERAVRAGREILREVQILNPRLEAEHGERLQVRIGIHTGPVVVGEMGGRGKRETLALGDTLNVAARLEAFAEPDTVVISDATLHLVAGLFVTEDRGTPALKGISEPIRVYRVIQPSGIASRLDRAPRLTPFVGREEELALLSARWEQAQEGRGQAVLIAGEAGIGKSRLVHRLRERLREAQTPHSWLECRSSPYTQNSALHPVIELAEQALRFEEEQSPEQKLERLERGLAGVGLDPTDTVQLLASLLSLRLPARYAPLAMSPQLQRQKTLEALLAWVLALGEKQPVVLLVEDLHWADPSTLEWLGLLIEQCATAGVLLLLTFRPDFEPPWPARGHVLPIALSRLSRRQAKQLAAAASGEALPEPVVDRLAARSDGIPLFVEELAKGVVESGRDLAGSLSDLAIPETLQDSLMARLDRLGEAKQVAQLGAAIGREFPYALLEAVAPLKELALREGLGRLLEAELVYQRGLPPKATYTFKHALVQDTAYGSLLESQRRELHGRIGDALEKHFPERVAREPEAMARHCDAAGRTAQAIPFWRYAGANAVRRSANAEALAHFERGLELVRSLPVTSARARQEFELLIASGPVLQALRGFAAPEAEATYTRARALGEEIGDPTASFLALFGQWMVRMAQGDLRGAQEIGEELLDLAHRSEDRELLLQAHHALWPQNLAMGNLRAVRRHVEEGCALYDPEHRGPLEFPYGGHDAGICAQFFGSWTLWALGYPDRARAMMEQALEWADRLAHPFTTALILYAAAGLHRFRRDESRARHLADSGVALSSQHGFRLFEGSARLERGWISSCYEGRDEGIREMRQGLSEWEAAYGGYFRPMWWALIGDGCLHRGRLEEAAAALAAAATLIDKNDERFYEAEVLRLGGELALARSPADLAAAEAAFLAAIEVACGQQARSWELRATTSLARLWQSQGRRKKARETLAEVYGWFTEGFDTADLKDAKALLDELA